MICADSEIAVMPNGMIRATTLRGLTIVMDRGRARRLSEDEALSHAARERLRLALGDDA